MSVIQLLTEIQSV